MECPVCGECNCVYLPGRLSTDDGGSSRELCCPDCGWCESDGHPEPKEELR